MTRFPFVLVLVLVLVLDLVLIPACSKPGEAGSCFREMENICVEHTKEQGAAGKKLCIGRWTAGEATCPTANRLGVCTRKDGAELVYSGPPNQYVAASAKSQCEFAGGTFASP